ncbi:MAG: DEAD/DEAH box helicase [Deltaproteobacteria bacterium]|nr:DEAD/DEAH box helicase [Deltaproteobacteria bacterium]
METSKQSGFSSLNLSESVLKAVEESGYENPTPIQELTIPFMLANRDIMAQAQTGTGKTAAFALPLLSKIDPDSRFVQILVLAPTRELAIQGASGFIKYSKYMKGLKVLPIYGGASYDTQLRDLKRGVQVVVGTPGRIMDHIRRGTLKIDNIKTIVLDEADEMLRMGFIDDVEWILEQTPSNRQTALFSATMPRPILRIAQKHLNNPEEIIIKSRTEAAESINQRFIVVPGAQKADALIKMLEIEDFDGVMVFTKTKTATVEVAEKLVAAGYSAAALNGDLSQNLREHTVNRLKKGSLDIIVATDVAARGLDVERISHVFNFDSPNDAETYVHRVGRTGRAGRTGESILFLSPRERNVLKNITQTTRQDILQISVPTIKDINERRIETFKTKITAALESGDLNFYKELIIQYCDETDVTPVDAAAAAIFALTKSNPLLLKETTLGKNSGRRDDRDFDTERSGSGRGRAGENNRRSSENGRGRGAGNSRSSGRRSNVEELPDENMERFRVEVGEVHGVKPGNLVGAIANEANIGSENIGKIYIHEEYSTVDLPKGMPRDLRRLLKRTWVMGVQLNLEKLDADKTKTTSDKTPAKRARTKTEDKTPEKTDRPARTAKVEKSDTPEKSEKPAKRSRVKTDDKTGAKKVRTKDAGKKKIKKSKKEKSKKSAAKTTGTKKPKKTTEA